MWLWLVSCDAGSRRPLELDVQVSQPTEQAPLVRRIHTESRVPVALEVSWTTNEHSASAAFTTSSEVHDHVLLAFRSDRTYTLTVTATAADGRVATVDQSVTTEPMPSHFPRSELTAGPGQREPGDTLVPMHSFIQVAVPTDIAAVWDSEGELVYWLDTEDFIYDVLEYEGGLLALIGEIDNRLVRYAWDGTVLESWAVGENADPYVSVSSAVADKFHHDVGVSLTATDRFLGIGRKGGKVPEYPASYDDPTLVAPRIVALDAVLEFDTGGKVSRELAIDTLIPLDRIGYLSLSTTVEGWADWAHANAVFEDESGNWIVSLRHQDVIVKIDPDTSEVVWLLGNHSNWPAELQDKLLTPVGELRWPYHTHGPELAARGPDGEVQIVVFDNGNYQASPYTDEEALEDPFSRVVQFAIDEEDMTVRQVWSFENPSGGRLFSEAVGNASSLPGGNVLSSWGFLDKLPDGTQNGDAMLGDRSVRVIEIDPTTVDQVEELYLYSPVTENQRGWTGYRARRIPPLAGRVVD